MRVLIATVSFAAMAFAVAISSNPQVDRSKAFYQAIRNNDLQGLSQLISAQGPNLADADGNTPLMIAALDGSPDAVSLLLKAGADPNKANSVKATPLMWCAGDAAKTKLLLDKGADPNAASGSAQTPLMLACNYDNSAEVVRLLLESGAKPNLDGGGDASPLEAAASMNNLKAAKLLVERGADVNHIDKSNTNALIAAVGNGHTTAQMVKYLLAHGATVKTVAGATGGNVKNGPIAIGSYTALHLAAELNGESTEALLQAGADVHALDVRGGTPLAFAVATDHPVLPAIKALLAHGASPAEAIDLARKYNNPKVLALLGAKAVAPADSEPGAPSDATKATMRSAVARALTVSQPAAANFFPAGGCVSCHAQARTGISVMAGAGSPIHADFGQEAGQAQATAGACDHFYQGMAQLQDPGGAADTAAMMLMQVKASNIEPSLSTDAFIHFICAYQHREGCWPEGAYPRPPMQDGDVSITIRAIRALRAYPVPALKSEIDERVDRACRWLTRYRPATVIDQSEQILGLAWAGKPVPPKWAKALEAKQRRNGGWGQNDGQPADSFATGEALMALRSAGAATTDEVYVKGVRFLLATQQPEGVWHVKTRAYGFQPYFQSGFPYDHDQWISQTGTALAVIALEEAAK